MLIQYFKTWVSVLCVLCLLTIHITFEWNKPIEYTSSLELNSHEVLNEYYSARVGNNSNIVDTNTLSLNEYETTIEIKCPSKIEVQCYEDIPKPNIKDVKIISDDKDDTFVVQFVKDDSDNKSCSEIITRTYSVTDSFGNIFYCSQTIIVNDTINPKIIDLSDYQLEVCNAPWPKFLTTKWSDNCASGGVIKSDDGINDGESEDGCIQYRLYTFTIKDDCGNYSKETTRIAREYDLTEPVIIDIADYSLDGCNTPWPEFLTTTWSDNCAEGGTIQSDSVVDDGTSEDGCLQYRLYTFNITDTCGNKATQTTRVTREYDMINPVIIDIADYSLDGCNTPWPEFLTTTWSDNCAEGGTIQSDSGVDDGTSEDGCIQYRLYTFTITDYCGNSDTQTTIVSREYDITNPDISNVADYHLATCNEDWPPFLTTTWTDNCAPGGDLQSDAGVDIESNEEDGCMQFRLYTFTVTDYCGNSDTQTTIVSREYDITNPDISNVADYHLATCNEDWPPFLTTTWTDNCAPGGDLQSDAGVDIESNEEDGCMQFRLYTFTVTDYCGNSDTQTTIVSREYDITNPDISNVADYHLTTCNEDWPPFLTTTWTDNCAPGGDLQSDAGVDIESNEEDGCMQFRLYTFTVTDYCGNSDTQTTIVSREYDITNPNISNVADYHLTTCNEDWPPFLTTAWTDNCAPGGDLQSDAGVDIESNEEDGCMQFRLYTFTVTDYCGNSDTQTTIVSREYDITNPDISNVADYHLTTCNEDWPPFLTTTWTDNCAPGGDLQSDAGVDIESNEEDGCMQFRLYTFTVTDYCGNSDTQTTIVSREYDITNPNISNVADYHLTTCNEDWPPFLTTAWTDNCAPGGDLQSDAGVDIESNEEDGCMQFRLYTFTVTDYCGNSDTQTTIVSREYDITNPDISNVADYHLTTCNEDWPPFLTTTWTDNCAPGGDLQSDAGVDIESNEEDGCMQFRLYTFTVTDYCGNSDTQTTIVSREYDITNPDISNVADYHLTTCNEDWPPFLTTTWTDNCAPGGDLQSDAGVDIESNEEDGCMQFRLYTFTVTDYCGNSDTQTTIVSREYDITNPNISNVADYHLTTCNEDWPPFLTTTWTDNCAPGGDLQSDAGVDIESNEEDGCMQFRLYTFTVTDYCGNSDTQTTIVSREYDITNPDIVDVPDSSLDGCNAPWPEYLPSSWSDNCSEGGTIQSDGGVDDGIEGDFEYRLYTFTQTDDCGNTDTETTRVGRLIDNSLESINGEKCILDNDIFDLFDYLVGDYNPNGEWIRTGGDMTVIDDHFFNPSTLLDSNGNYTDDQLNSDYVFTYKVNGVCGNEIDIVITLNNDCDPICSEVYTGDLCILDDDNFDLFSYLDVDYNPNGEWIRTGGDLMIINEHFINPSTLLDSNGNYTDDQLSAYNFSYKVEGMCDLNVKINLNNDCDNGCASAIDEEIISTALSPNGDGDNDTFNAGITQPSAAASCVTVHVQIFNRWGAKIYESQDYKNTWQGTVPSNAFGPSGSITTGTYFYIIRFKSNLDSSKKYETVTGYFYAITSK